MGHLTDEQRARLALRVTGRCIRLADGDVDAALSAAEQIADEADDKELSRLYRREFGTTAERGADRARQRATLRTLSAALSTMRPFTEGIRLALDDQEPSKPVTLYGVTGPLPVFPAVSETSELFGKPEQ